MDTKRWASDEDKMGESLDVWGCKIFITYKLFDTFHSKHKKLFSSFIDILGPVYVEKIAPARRVTLLAEPTLILYLI